DNMRAFGLPVVVALNHFSTDTPEETELALQHCTRYGVGAALADPFGGGAEGCQELALAVREVCSQGARVKPIYDPSWPVTEKIEAIAEKMYGAARVNYSRRAREEIEHLTRLGCDKLHVIVAKTPNSLSDNPALRGRPERFDIDVDRVHLAAGA